MAKIVRKPKAKPTRDVAEIINELEVLKAQKKIIESRDKELRAILGDIAESTGTIDNKGSYKLVVGDKVLQKQARKSVKLNKDRAEKFFRELGIWNEVIETVEVINDDFVEQQYLAEAFSADDLEAITDVKVVYAVAVTDYVPEEEMSEVVSS